MKYILFLLCTIMLLISRESPAQSHVEIIGNLKLEEVDTLKYAESILALNGNGTVVSIPASKINPPADAIDLPFMEDWTNYGNGYQACTYHKHGGRVYLSGLASTTNSIEIGDTIAILPPGYQPFKRTMGYGKYDHETVRLNIEPDGAIVVISGPTGQDWLDLTGISFGIKPYYIGGYEKGGIVFYIAEPPADLNGDGILDNGLIAASDDLAEYMWGCYGTEINGASGQNIGTGYQNTMNIISGCSENPISASSCNNLVINGYDDWFLPARYEMTTMNENIGQLATGANYNIGNLSGTYYTSSQSNANFSYLVDITGLSVVAPKIVSRKSRPVRVF